jgi:hypothetical protein
MVTKNPRFDISPIRYSPVRYSLFLYRWCNYFGTCSGITVTFNCKKFTAMKRYIIILVLMICLAAVAFATLQSSKNKAGIKNVKTEKQKEVKKNKECRHTCPFS